MSTEYKINLNIKDYLAILFRRNKRCLHCSSAVTRVSKRTLIDKGNVIKHQGHSVEISNNNKHFVTTSYVCNACGKSFLPREFW